MPLVSLGALCLFSACSSDDLSDRKHVATVNGEKIYWDEYQKRLNAQKGLLSPKTFRDASNKRKLLEEEILESMITEQIILQRAREIGLSVSNTELERKLIDIRKDYGINFFDCSSRKMCDMKTGVKSSEKRCCSTSWWPRM